jgi:nucleoside-diphosphate-sugar epimerase
MKVAITGAGGVLGQALLPRLAAVHEVSPTDIIGTNEPANVLIPEDMSRLCAGNEMVIHLAQACGRVELSDAENETAVLDTRLTGTYNLLEAAAEAGVRQVIQISDVCVYSGYPKEIVVSEDFVPLPDTSAVQQSIYLSELIARAFSRSNPGLPLTLRLGTLVESAKLPTDAVFDPSWLDIDDAVDAILRALDIERYDPISNWGLYNLTADQPRHRFSLLKIKSGVLGFQPQRDFAAWISSEAS